MSKKQDTRNASQKITDLENAFLSLYQTSDNMVRDINLIKGAVKLLGNKVDSIVKASTRGESISDPVIQKIMVENNCEELAQKVREMVARGTVVPQDQVGDDSFIVGAEIEEDGSVANPRIQFGLTALQPDLQGKLKGARAGDTVTLAEGKLKLLVKEVYQILPPTEAQAPSTEQPVAETPTEANPATPDTATA